VGIVTAWAEESGKEIFEDIAITNHPCETSTTFSNEYTASGRVQKISHLAPELAYYHIPESWRKASLVHLAPVAREVPPNIIRMFPESRVYLTLQGWLRRWDEQGHVAPDTWPEAAYILQQAHAAVLSEEDVEGDQTTIEAMAAAAPVLVVTRGAQGADLYTRGSIHHIPAPTVQEVDPTGAGDIFAAAFFAQLHYHGNPLQAAQFAVLLASDSVTRPGLAGAPTEETLYQINKEVQ
jgi:sugar/nucleoside kinase (ribokinase family)